MGIWQLWWHDLSIVPSFQATQCCGGKQAPAPAAPQPFDRVFDLGSAHSLLWWDPGCFCWSLQYPSKSRSLNPRLLLQHSRISRRHDCGRAVGVGSWAKGFHGNKLLTGRDRFRIKPWKNPEEIFRKVWRKIWRSSKNQKSDGAG